MAEVTNVTEYQAIAKEKFPKMVYDYYASGAEDQWSLAENRNAFSRILFRPRILIDVSKIDMTTTILGFKISMPIMIAPTAMQKMAHPEEYATARAASAAGTIMDEIGEEDQRLLESFLSKDDRPQRTLADIIVEKLKKNDAQVSSGVQPTPKLDDSIIELYKGVGKLLNKYTSGKIPKAFKHVPSLQFWEEVLYLTEPEKWSPNAMYQATRIFSSNMGDKKLERFYKLVLLPRVREDIRKNKRLHFALYQSLKKALY